MELKDYLRPLRKWWWLIVLATLVAAVSAYFAMRQQPPIYRTRTTLMVGTAIENPNPNGNEFWLSQQLANTYADIVKRDNVRAAVMQRANLTFLPEYTARVVPSTQLIELTVTDIHPLRAQQVAQALADELINISPAGPGGKDQQRQAFISNQLNDLEVKIQETQAEIDKKQTELANLFSARQIADAQTQLTALQNKKTTLQANYAALLSNTQRGALNSITIIEPPALNPIPVGPNRSASILLAAAIGALLAIAAAFLLDYLDDTLKNPDDVEKALGLTTLGAAPKLEGKAGELAALSGGNSAAAEAYRVLRTNLQFAAAGSPIRTLLVTSPSPGEGKSLTATNLALALAQAGRRVILVDADLRKPRAHRLLGLKNNVGLTTALIAEPAEFESLLDQGVLQPGPEEGLSVITSGPLPPNPAELLGSGRARDLIARLAQRADTVVFDSPPATALSDAAILGAQVDGVLLVLEAGHTRREVARRALEALRKVNARVVGALLNRMPLKGEAYDYYYYYQHSDGYTYASNNRGNGNGRARRSRRQEPAGRV
jgi:polysaccharide biosynthesis transport protein